MGNIVPTVTYIIEKYNVVYTNYTLADIKLPSPLLDFLTAPIRRPNVDETNDIHQIPPQ